MQFRCGQILIGLLAAMSMVGDPGSPKQVKIIDTGSTNRPGIELTLDAKGEARTESRGVEPRTIHLDAALCRSFLSAVQSAAPLSSLPAARCARSVSFGSRLFVEYDGEQSPDLNCPQTENARLEALRKGAAELLAVAKNGNRSQK